MNKPNANKTLLVSSADIMFSTGIEPCIKLPAKPAMYKALVTAIASIAIPAIMETSLNKILKIDNLKIIKTKDAAILKASM